MRRATATALHYLAAGIGFIGGGYLVIAAQAIEWRAVRIERAGDGS